MPTSDDLNPSAMPQATAGGADHSEALERIVADAAARATDAIQWYLVSKRSKSRWARILRVAAIVGVAAAGVIPVIVLLVPESGAKPAFNAAWASVAIAGSAFCVALDRFFGFSTAWIRYITTEMQIQQLLHAFQYDWQLDRAGWSGGDATRDQYLQTLTRCKAFVQQIDQLVQQETNLWVVEFQDVLKQVDDASRARPAVVEQAAINIVVTSASEAESGWLLAVDGGTPTTRFGNSAAVSVAPGTHVVSVSASNGAMRRAAERAVTVQAGATVEVALAL
jgi:hypothetical protein